MDYDKVIISHRQPSYGLEMINSARSLWWPHRLKITVIVRYSVLVLQIILDVKWGIH